MSHPSSASGTFVVATSHGTTLRINREGRVFHSLSPTASATDLVLYIPPGARTAGFLIAAQPNDLALKIEADTPAKIIPLRLQRTSDREHVAFCHPFTGRYLSAFPATAGVSEPAVVIDRAERNGWETFRLQAANSVQLAVSTINTMATLAKWAQEPMTGPRVFTLMEAGIDRKDADAFDAFCRLLPDDQVSWLAPTILGHPRVLDRLAETFTDDLFATEGLPNLNTWLATRPQTKGLDLPPDRDQLAVTGLDGNYITFAHMCCVYARRCIPARKKLCILATARNEGLYLLEWIAYHQSIGVDGFFIYSNDNNDGSDLLLAALAQANVITWIRSELHTGGSAQPKAYGHALGLLPSILDYRWSLIIDLDEFFAFDHTRFDTVADYIDWHETRPVDAVALNWLVYGSSGQDRWRDEPLITRFTRRLPWLDPHVKTMVRTNQVMQSRPHHPVTDERHPLITRNASGALHQIADSPSFSRQPEASTAWINHYFLKSAEEFVWKFSRNRGDHALTRDFNPAMISQTFLDMFVSQHRSPNVTLDDRALGCAPTQGEHMAALRALPGMLDALAVIHQRFHGTISHLKSAIADMPEFRVPNTTQAQLAAFLGL